MARPIKETPILYGEDARRFEARMKETRTESPEEREKRIRLYEMLMATANFWDLETVLIWRNGRRANGTLPSFLNDFP